MIFEPGKSYYMLTSDQYNEMLAIMTSEGYAFDLATDFQPADDGNYYVAVDSGSVNSDECTFLEEWGLLNPFLYKKSTQSTSPV